MRIKMRIKNQDGAAAVEFAIVLLFLISLLAGIIEFGLLFYNNQVIINASREGARTGIIQGTTVPEIKSTVKDYCRKRLITFGTPISELPDGWITINNGSGIDPSFQADLKVYVEYHYTYLMPSIFGFDSTKKISAQTVMKMEQTPSGS
jgi:hypothetical protein